jgi:hypothetical protein
MAVWSLFPNLVKTPSKGGFFVGGNPTNCADISESGGVIKKMGNKPWEERIRISLYWYLIISGALGL